MLHFFLSAPTSTLCFVMLQVVETNLVAFDCHWILINEVSVMEIIYGSSHGRVFISPYSFNYPGNTGPQNSPNWLAALKESAEPKSFLTLPSLLFHPEMDKTWWPRTFCFISASNSCYAPRGGGKDTIKISYVFILASSKRRIHQKTKVQHRTKVNLEELFGMSVSEFWAVSASKHLGLFFILGLTREEKPRQSTKSRSLNFILISSSNTSFMWFDEKCPFLAKQRIS